MPGLLRPFTALAIALTIGGCVGANMVSSPRSDSAYGPINEGERVGVIKYLNAGADSVIKARREDAYKQMFDACSGRYEIVAEGGASEGGTVIATGNSTTYVTSQYWYIQFKCVQ